MAKKVKKRSKAEELQMAFKWINSLSHEKTELIRIFTDSQINKDRKNMLNILDRCVSAALINTLDLDMSTIKKVEIDMVNFIEDDTKKIRENKEIYGGLEMAIKKIDEQEKLIEKRVNELINEGTKQNEMVKILTKEFPVLSKAMITNAIKRIKSERLKKTDDAAKYILEDNKKIKEKIMIDAKEIAKKVADNLEEELEKEYHIAEVSQMIKENEKEVKEKKQMPKLKVKRMEVDGEFGSYVREGNKVIAGDITFNSLEEAENYYKKEIEILTNKIQEIKEVYSI